MNPISLANLAVRVTADPTQYLQTMNTVENRFMRTFNWISRMGHRLQELGRIISFAVVAPLVTFGLLATKEFAKWDQAITRTMAITNNASQQIRKNLERIALAGRGITGPSERAGMLYYLTAQGLSIQTAARALESFDTYALVSGTKDATKSVKELSAALAALGMQAMDPQIYENNLNRLMDSVTRAANVTQAEVADILTAIGGRAAARMRLQSGGVVSDAVLKQLVSLGAGLVHMGAGPEEARTAIDIAFRDIDRGFREHTALWRRLGLEVWDPVTKKMKEPMDVLRQLSQLVSRVPPQMRAGLLRELGFQERSMSSLIRVLTNMPLFENILGDQANAAGTMKRMKEIMGEAFTVQLIRTLNTLKKVSIEFGQNLAPVLLKVNDFLDEQMERWRAVNPAIRKTIEHLIMFTAVAWPLSILVRNLATTVLVFVMGPLMLLRAGLLAILSPIRMLAGFGLAIIVKLMTLTASFLALLGSGSVMAAFPLLGIVGILGAIAGAVYLVIQYVSGAGGLEGAWQRAGEAIGNFAKNAFGFFVNFEHNAGVIIQWFRENWTKIWTDAGSIIVTFAQNIGHNFMVGMTAIGSIFGEFFSWFGENWEMVFRDVLKLTTMFTINMAHNVWILFRMLGRIGGEWLSENWQPLMENAGIIARGVFFQMLNWWQVTFQVMFRIAAAIIGAIGHLFVQFGLWVERGFIALFNIQWGAMWENAMAHVERFLWNTINKFGEWGRTITRIIERALAGDLRGVDELIFGQPPAPKRGPGGLRERAGPIQEIWNDFQRQFEGDFLMPHIGEIIRDGIDDLQMNPLQGMPALREMPGLAMERIREIVAEEMANMRAPLEGFEAEANYGELGARIGRRLNEAWGQMRGPLEGFQATTPAIQGLRFDIPEMQREAGQGPPTPGLPETVPDDEFDMDNIFDRADWGRDLERAAGGASNALNDFGDQSRDVGNTFKEMSLRRFILSAPYTSAPTAQSGTENRLDKLIKIEEDIRRIVSAESQLRAARGDPVLALMKQGIESPRALMQLLNFDEMGRRVNNYTMDEITGIQEGFIKKLAVGEAFRGLRDSGAMLGGPGFAGQVMGLVNRQFSFSHPLTEREVDTILRTQLAGGKFEMESEEKARRRNERLQGRTRGIQTEVTAEGVESRLDTLIDLVRKGSIFR